MIKFDLSNKVAIVTGGAQGFGFAITERFVKSGAKVIIWDIDKKTAEEAIKKINSENCIYQIVDVKNFDQISKNMIEVEKKFNKIDIFINNAGITGSNATIAEYSVDEWKKVIDLNLNSVFYCCKAVVPYMIKNNYGRIVNIASIAGKISFAKGAGYCATKHGLIGYSGAVFEDLRDYNVKVCAICPGYVNTDLVVNRGLDVNKMIQPEDIADTVGFVLGFSSYGCPTEIVIRPQKTVT